MTVAGPLAGLTVVEFGLMIAGPYAGRLLADAGAEVIKVEPPAGDPMRSRTPIREGSSTYFGALNAGKRSIVLDLKTTAGRERAQELVAGADVLLENYRPSVMERLGLGWETCRATNERLLYCSVSGYGQEGATSTYPAYAPILHALSGYDLVNMGYQKDAERPAATGTFLADIMAGQVAYGAVVTALRGREQTGHGERLDVALMDVMLSMMVYETQAAQTPDPGPAKTVYRPMRAGRDFVIVACITDRNFQSLAAAMGEPALLRDPRFATVSAREHHWEEFQDMIERWVADREAGELVGHLLDAGVPCARYRTLAEALADEQVTGRGTLREAVDAAGPFRFVGTPYLSSSFPAPTAPAAVPELDEMSRA